MSMQVTGWAVRELEGTERDGGVRARRESLKRALRSGSYEGMQKKQVAAALGISRWTLDRYLAEIERESRAAEVIG